MTTQGGAEIQKYYYTANDFSGGCDSEIIQEQLMQPQKMVSERL